MGEGKRGKPGSELERLVIFEQLAAEYFRMVALFQADAEPPAVRSSAGGIERERRHWIELFRAALLRKFIVRDEHVSLKLVVRALRLCNYSADRHLTEGTEQVVELFTAEMVQGRQPVQPGSGQGEGPAPDEGPDRFEDVLYGRLLHGDADRFHRSSWANDYARLSVAADSRFDAEHALAKALELVRYGFAHDLLRSPEAAVDAAGPPADGPPAADPPTPDG
ncbi:hypothetical protein [Arthrobacter sp. C9C5]|uniref:hypothetical protein n=1 Tax=Arthrobacter sp. C9C5 TaxID=2735267 RepID=UPI0015846613|nr:hypothetical protein [Arthrobacter sp. C9C5]NUU32522.1 hypothetical protein [Arthrobacter sp. C9C5]